MCKGGSRRPSTPVQATLHCLPCIAQTWNSDGFPGAFLVMIICPSLHIISSPGLWHTCSGELLVSDFLLFLVPHVYLNPALWTTLPTSTHSPAVAVISLRLRAVAGAKACRHATLREARQGALNYYHGEKMQSFPFMKNMSLISSCLLWSDRAN